MAETRYTCARCGETFEAEWSQAEAEAEARALFGVDHASTRPDMAVLCDDCFERFKRWWVTEGRAVG